MSEKTNQRQQVAAKLGHLLGPIDERSRWSPEFVPSWPIDYSTQERRTLLSAADAVIELLRGPHDH